MSTDMDNPDPLTVDDGRLFWGTAGREGSAEPDPGVYVPKATIRSINPDGTGLRSIANLPEGKSGTPALAVDGEHVYWLEPGDGGGTGRVMRARKDGGEVTVLAGGQATPWDLAVDECSVYWTTLGTKDAPGAVRSAPK